MEVIRYLFWGVATTVINFIAYFVFSQFIDNILITNTIAWFISIIFAYVSNTLFVFQEKKLRIKQFFEFGVSRLSTLVVELVLMFILVNIALVNDKISKIAVNVVVIILNYVISKLFIYKKNNCSLKGK